MEHDAYQVNELPPRLLLFDFEYDILLQGVELTQL